MMDRKIYKNPFTKDDSPIYGCPTCEKGQLRLKQETFKSEEKARSRDHSHDDWEPEWVEMVYTCFFQCSNKDCHELVVNSGVGFVDWECIYDDDGVPTQEYFSFFRPQYFVPSLKFFKIPAKCPAEVKSPLEESFSLALMSPSSSANKIRTSIENLLTSLGIKRFRTVKGTRHIISLHQRISLLPVKYDELKNILFAIKWLGNAGSHKDDGVTIDDIFDAYELADHLLQEIYESKRKTMKTLAQKINRKKGPIN